MNRDDIIAMARDAGAELAELPRGDAWLFTDDKCLERFAALVASAEREACAKECDIQASFGNDDERFGARQCGYAIRARGQA